MFVAIERFELPLTESESVVLTITLKGNMWGRQDSNLQSREATDLQSVPLPITVYVPKSPVLLSCGDNHTMLQIWATGPYRVTLLLRLVLQSLTVWSNVVTIHDLWFFRPVLRPSKLLLHTMFRFRSETRRLLEIKYLTRFLIYSSPEVMLQELVLIQTTSSLIRYWINVECYLL